MLVGGIFLIFNFLTPYVTDDYDFFFIHGTNIRLASFSDVWQSQYNFYFNWSGRLLTGFFLQLFLLGSKAIFNIFNVLIYLIFVWLVGAHITGSLKKVTPRLFILLNILFWLFTPDWGEVFLWLTGSCVYLFSAVIVLAFLLAYRQKIKSEPPFYSSLAFLFLGLAAGWAFETMGAAAFCFLFVHYAIKILKKEKIYIFEILGTVGFILGLLFLLGAPGNYVRATAVAGWNNNSGFILFVLGKRFISVSILFFIKYYGLLIFGIITLAAILLQQRQKVLPDQITTGYFLAGLTGLYSIILVDTAPGRSFFIPLIFFIIAALRLGRQLYPNYPLSVIVKTNLAVLLGLFMVSTLNIAMHDMLGIWQTSKYAEKHIFEQKARGISNIEIPAADFKFARDKHTAGNIGITYKADYWTSIPIAKFYGVKSVKLVE